MKKESLKEKLEEVDRAARKQRIYFTREEAVADDLYD